MKGILILGSLWALVAFGGGVAPGERALLVITELKKDVEPKWEAIYQFAEKHSVSEARARVGSQYGRLVSLEREEATLDRFTATLSALAAEPGVRAIDVLVHLHGFPGHLRFWDGGHDTARVAARLASDRRLGEKLRALHSTACYGSSHGPDWLAAGFKVAAGARKVNTDSLFAYPTFLRTWGRGETFGTAQDKANEPRWVAFFDRIATNLGFGDTDSHKEIHGNADLRIDQLP